MVTGNQMHGFVTEIRGVTLHQPWAWAIAVGLKPSETRSWPTSYRGWLAVHGGKTVDQEFCEDALHRYGIRFNYAAACRSGIVAVAYLADCVRTELVTPGDDEAFWGNFERGRYAWRFSDWRSIEPPIPHRGYQGLWPVEPKALERLRGYATRQLDVKGRVDG